MPNKGSLADTASEMLHEAGYTGRRDPKDLHVIDPQNEVEFFYLRPKDIATYVGSGALDVGITGRDLLLRRPDAGCPRDRGTRLRRLDVPLRGSPGRFTTVEDLEGVARGDGLSRASSTDSSTNAASRSIWCRSTARWNPQCDWAWPMPSRTSSRPGPPSSRQGSRSSVRCILESEAVLIAGPAEVDGTETLLRRLRGVWSPSATCSSTTTFRHASIDAAVAVAPGIESPTISPLRDPEWVAVRVMSPRKGVNQVMDALYAIGASAILVTAIHTARL